MKSSVKSKGVDLVAGSEKILRVHHRNMVHARYLQHSMDNLDAICKRNLNRVQQEIYNVYYSEYLPLQEWRKKIEESKTFSSVKKGTKRFGFAGDGRVKQKCKFPDLTSSTASIYSSTPSMLSGISGVVPLPSIFNKPKDSVKPWTADSNNERTCVPLSAILKIPEEERSKYVDRWKEEFDRNCPSVISRAANTSPEIDKDRLQIIRSAISLTSKPPPENEHRRNRRLRRSFLATLRKPSVFVKNTDANGERESHTKRRSSVLVDKSGKSVSQEPASSTEEKINEHLLASNSSMRDFADSVKDAPHTVNLPSFQHFPISPADESYYTDTPDIFSEIGEEPSSYEESEYDGSSYTYTGSSGSLYWEYTDEESSFSEDER